MNIIKKLKIKFKNLFIDNIKHYNENSLKFFNETAYIDMSETYDKFLKYLKNGDIILDAGSDSVRDTKFFLENGFKVIAIDSSKEMVDLSSNFTGNKT